MASTLHHFVCVGCSATVTRTAATRCPECGGSLYGRYQCEDTSLTYRPRHDIWRYAPLLPTDVDEVAPVTLGEGGAPIVSCRELAEAAGVADLRIQDDGRSTTASGLADRGASVVATAARERGASDLVLASTGTSAVALAAYAARVGEPSRSDAHAVDTGTATTDTDAPAAPGTGDRSMSVHAFVPARSPFAHKALFNVHGGDMRVVSGRYDDAVAALREASADDTDPVATWTPAGPDALPHWVEGAKTAALEAAEIVETLPDAIVCPVGHGVAIAGWWRGLRALQDAGRLETVPRLYGVQAGGCAPIVDAVEAGARTPTPLETPDTLSGALEVPDPAVGDLAIEAIAATDGDAVAVSDEALLEAGVRVSRTSGLEVGTPGATAVAGVAKLVETGALTARDRVLVYNPTAATPEADLFRSHLMRRGE
jgi:threonine synthase